MTQSPSVIIGSTETGRPAPTPPGARDPSQTRRLLACGAVAGPLFVAAALAQALTRPGFDITRDAVSLLDNGSLGWVQVANFIVTGVLFVVAAAGLRRAVRTGPGHRWLSRLVIIAGAGLIGGGLFHPDPSGGFPPGTPAGGSAVSSWPGAAHMVCGSASFGAMIVACFVLARRLSASGRRGAAACSRGAGVACAAGIAASGASHGSLSLFAGVSVALLWLALAMARLGAADESCRLAYECQPASTPAS